MLCAIDLKDVYFFEKMGRKVNAVFRDKKIEYYGSLYQLEEIIKSRKFVRCHQSYIVNCEKVLMVDKDEIVFKDIVSTIYVSEKYKNDLIGRIEKAVST